LRPFSGVIDSAEPFGPELTAEGLVAGCFLYACLCIFLTPDTPDTCIVEKEEWQK
jgi:hypothetical protein